MMTSDALVAFLGARLDEIEAVAKAATPGPWTVAKAKTAECDELAILAGEDGVVDPGYVGGGVWDRPDADHIALHDPARALREVEADRTLIDLYRRSKSYRDRVFARPEPRSVSDEMRAVTQMLAVEQVLILRAGIYSNHPDYRQDWKR